MSFDPDVFLSAGRVAHRLAASSAVAVRWDDESACAGMTVGGLAHHLLNQAGNTVRALREPPRAHAPIGVREHYERAAWAHSGLDDADNVDIRTTADDAAHAGPAEVLAGGAAALAALPGLLAAERDPDTVYVPWQGWSLSTSDWLVTRSMEVVVHSDDLAASVGLPTPDFAAEVTDAVLELLLGVAVRRHGALALVRALSRPQRAPAVVSAF